MEQQQVEQQQQVASTSDRPACYVIVYNVSKKHNVGTLLRSCSAFNVTEVCLVGSNQYNSFGSHGASDHVNLRHFPTIDGCVQYLKEQCGCTIVGVEIDPSAKPIHQHPFNGNTAFMLGNEGQGLSTKQIKLCDSFVYIPQYGGGTASLNVTVAASIILQNFAVWAGYTERQREGAKFVVDERPARTRSKSVVPGCEDPAAVRAQRQAAGVDSEGEAWLEAAMMQHGGVEGLMAACTDGKEA